MESLSVTDFDLAATLNSGQAFHWHPTETGFAGLMGAQPIELAQPDPQTLLVTADTRDLAIRYLGLDHDLPR